MELAFSDWIAEKDYILDCSAGVIKARREVPTISLNHHTLLWRGLIREQNQYFLKCHP